MMKLVASVAVAAALALACPIAGAACADGAGCPDEGGGGRLRLDLSLCLLAFTYSYGADTESSSGEQSFGFAVGPAPVTRVGFGIGRELTDRLSLGARLDLGFSAFRRTQTGSEEEETELAFDYAVLPYLEYAFGADRIRPFVTVVAGVDGTVARSKYEGRSDMGKVTDEHTNVLTLGAVGLGGGLHVFLADRASLDLWLLELAGFGELEDAEDYRGEQDETYGHERFAWRSRTELFVGLTGWI